MFSHAHHASRCDDLQGSQEALMLKSQSLEITELFALTSGVQQCPCLLILESTGYARATCICKGLTQSRYVPLHPQSA